jgi:hypothetical protein
MFARKNQPAHTELLWNVEKQISQRTLGQVHNLQIEARDNRVVVRGCTPSYFVKQLAIHAALEVLEKQAPLELDMQLRVLSRD